MITMATIIMTIILEMTMTTIKLIIIMEITTRTMIIIMNLVGCTVAAVALGHGYWLIDSGAGNNMVKRDDVGCLHGHVHGAALPMSFNTANGNTPDEDGERCARPGRRCEARVR